MCVKKKKDLLITSKSVVESGNVGHDRALVGLGDLDQIYKVKR